MQNLKIKEKARQKTGQKFNRGWIFAVSVFVLVFASGLAITQTALAGVDQNGDGSIDPYEACLGSAVGASCNGALYGLCAGAKGALGTGCYASPAVCKDGVWGGAGLPACVATKLCPDTDGDGRGKCRIYGDSPPSGEYSFESRPGDCDDNDVWSHSYASANIQSVTVDFEPNYVVQTKSGKKYTPKSPYNLLDVIQSTVTFKKKCGLKTPTPEDLSMSVFIVLGDGREILISEGLSKKADFVYNISVDLQTIMTEDLIAAIAKNPSWRLKLIGSDILSNKNAPTWSQPDTPKKDTPKYASLPMTNCAQVYGGGTKKMIFMRGQSANMLPGALVGTVTRLLFDPFGLVGNTPKNGTNPYKTYASELSFFADLRNYYDATWRDKISVIAIPGVSTPFPEISSVSSCGRLGSVYLAFIDMPTLKVSVSSLPGSYKYLNNIEGLVSLFGKHVVAKPDANVLMLIHEISHAFAKLNDESTLGKAGRTVPTTNCSFNPLFDYKYKGTSYGGSFEGCMHVLSDIVTRRIIYRSSQNSIMNDNMGLGTGTNFNIVSCGYVMKALKGGTAHSYFPECAAMPGIIPVGS